MVCYLKKKSVLFIEPCLSFQCFMHKVKMKGYQIIVISGKEDYLNLPKKSLMAPSAFFQVDTLNEEAVLTLVELLAEKFRIEGVIPGYGCYGVLTAKVANYLKKPGMSLKTALKIHQKYFLQDSLKERCVPLPTYYKVETKRELEKATDDIKFPCVLKSIHNVPLINAKKIYSLGEAYQVFESILNDSSKKQLSPKGVLVEEYIEGQEYNIAGLIKNRVVHILSFTEKFLSSDQDRTELGYIVRSGIDQLNFQIIETYLQKVVSALNLDCGAFNAKIKLSEKGPILLKFNMNIANHVMAKLINYTINNDYYDNIFELFSAQPFSFHRVIKSNVGIIFFYKKFMKRKSLNHYFNKLSQNSAVVETIEYCKNDISIKTLPADAEKIGHVLLVHKDYETLKNSMREVGSLMEISGSFFTLF